MNPNVRIYAAALESYAKLRPDSRVGHLELITALPVLKEIYPIAMDQPKAEGLFIKMRKDWEAAAVARGDGKASAERLLVNAALSCFTSELENVEAEHEARRERNKPVSKMGKIRAKVLNEMIRVLGVVDTEIGSSIEDAVAADGLVEKVQEPAPNARRIKTKVVWG